MLEFIDEEARFEDEIHFARVADARREAAQAEQDARVAAEAIARHATQLEAAQKALEAARAGYQRALDDFAASPSGDADEAILSGALERREKAQRAYVQAQDIAAALKARSDALNKHRTQLQVASSAAYGKDAAEWLTSAAPGLEAALLAAMENLFVARLITKENPAAIAYEVEGLVERVSRSAIARSRTTIRRLELGD